MLSRFHRISERNGWTDNRRADGRTDRIAISISRVSMLTRDKNQRICSARHNKHTRSWGKTLWSVLEVNRIILEDGQDYGHMCAVWHDGQTDATENETSQAIASARYQGYVSQGSGWQNYSSGCVMLRKATDGCRTSLAAVSGIKTAAARNAELLLLTWRLSYA